MALYFYFNETTGDLVYSDKATYGGSGYTSLGQQTNMNPSGAPGWVFDSKRSDIVTVSKDKSVVGKISWPTSMASMFYGCNSLTSIDLSGLDTSAVKYMNYMFAICTNLASLDLSSLDTSAVTTMNQMFYNCSGLTSLDLSGLDTSAVTNMQSMFQGCGRLTSLDLSGFDTSAVRNMSSMFYGCNSLTSLDLSGFDTSAVTSMNAMFNGCSGLTSLDLSNFDTSTVAGMNGMFDNCTNLRLITISGWISDVLSNLPADQYYPAAGGDPAPKGSLTAGTWVRDEADLTKVTSLVEQAQMSQAISRRITKMYLDLHSRLSALEKHAG